MDQPTHDLRIHGPAVRQDMGTRTVIGIVVLLLHVGLIAAIIAGLKTGFILVPKELETEVFKPKDEAKAATTSNRDHACGDTEIAQAKIFEGTYTKTAPETFGVRAQQKPSCR